MKQSASLSGLAMKRSKLCNWGVIWRKKYSDETGIDFRRANILTKGGSDNHFLKPICKLCEQPYNSDLMYIHCETCRKWYHAEAVEIEESRISDVVGFKCCKCRRIRGPECPFMDSELREQKRKKRFGKPQKQGQGSIVLDSDFGTISNFKECNPITPIISTKDELVPANDPLFFSLSKIEQRTENNSEVDAELNSASGPGLQKLPVRRHMKREGEVDGLAGGDVEHAELSTCPEPNDFVVHKEDSPLPSAEWDVSGNGLEGYCHQDCTLSSMHMNEKVECLIICKQCYHAKVLAQNEINTKSPSSLLPLQGRDCHSATAVTKGMQVKSSTQPMKPLAPIRIKENSVRIQERSSDMKQSASLSGLATKRSKLCNWGVIWRKKYSDETGIDFRRVNILTKGGSDNHFLKPICELCEQPYNSDLMYIHCETCRKWYHAEAVEIEESRISDVVGFKCCKCRRIRGPECPFMDPELREQKRNKRFGKPQKQGQGSVVLDSDFGTISNFKESV